MKIKEKLWKNNDNVYFLINKNKYYGTIVDCNVQLNEYKVKFISAIKNGENIFAEGVFKEDELKRYRKRLNSWIFIGDLVEFITENNGLKLGRVLDIKTIGDDELYDFAFYNITNKNKIEYCTNKNVSKDRITYISTSENEYKILPIKRGNKVEFNSYINKKRISGVICDIYGGYDLPLFSLKYTIIDEYGEKERIIEDDISLNDIFTI